MSSEARIALFCLIGLLLMILGFLVAFALVFRKQAPHKQSRVPSLEPDESLSPGDIREIEEVVMTSEAVFAEAASLDSSGEAVACPTCRREFEVSLEYCPHDARRLVPASEIIDAKPKNGTICPRCQRTFEPGMRFCSYDATELVRQAIFTATRGRKASPKMTGVIGKICPRCSRRHDLSATFCSKDGAELVIIN